MNASTAAKKARLARKLRDRPLVREALPRGEVTARKAEILMPVAVGDKQMLWILRAKAEPVRALRKAVRAKPDPDDEEWHRLTAAVAPEQRPILDEGLRWGGIVLGARSKKVERVEAWGQEYLSAHEAPEGRDVADPLIGEHAGDVGLHRMACQGRERQRADEASRGRSHQDNDIRLPDTSVHRYHAVIEQTRDEAFVITDLSGTDGNGIRVNGERLARAQLADGDVIELGRTRLKFESVPV